MNTVWLATAMFKNKISPEEVFYFRGSMIQLSGGNVLFHNHKEEGLKHTYPLIQYKRINGYAAIVGINEGSESIKELFESKKFVCQIGNRKAEMEVAAISTSKCPVECKKEMQTYMLKNWFPLNSGNYREYQRLNGLIARTKMLEKILVGNILSFAKGVGIYIEEPIVCSIIDFENNGTVHYKEIDLMNFSVEFQTNVTLPESIGLGKSVSINNGMITRIKL